VKNSTGTTIEKNVFDSGSRKIATTANGITTLYLYDGWNCIAEYTRSVGVSPTLQKTRLWGTDLSGFMQGAGGVGGMLSESSPITSNPITFNSSYPTYDGNGNVSEYLSANGTIAAHFEYDPFGNTVVNTDTGNLFAYRFSTKPRDTETGLYYYGYRYYDPLTGRWPSRDPIEEEGGVNLYGFVGNDVVNRWDLFGLAGWEDYKIVAKSYIDGVGTVGNIRSNAAWLPSELIAANIRLRAFAALAGILPAFNQFPADDSKDGEYRLFGEIKTKFCCDGDKIMNKDWSTDKEGGVEEEHIGISGTVDFSPTINAVGDKFEIEWFLYGRPHRAAELGMQAVQIRTSTQIWQKGKVTFSCKGGEIQKTEDFFKGSRYPTRQYWINDASGNRKDKGPLSSLWSESPSMPGFVAE
jgi:RHS repeat-associated protein